MNEVCRGPDCEGTAFSWLGQQYCSSTCRWAAGRRALRPERVPDIEEDLLAIDLAVTSASPAVVEHVFGHPLTVEDVQREPAGSTILEDIRRLYHELPKSYQGSVKLTRDQLITLRSSSVIRTPWPPPRGPHLAALPIEMVDTVEESTPYEFGYRPPRGFTPDVVIMDEALEPAPPSQRGWLRRALDRLSR